ncbi:helix-turn-helix transcriptional regulator [Actinoplanes solisilvae]|uniref:helix-turn-helix transcriptional regulator n=1 Tax=Actinoplanes solisilvae TaxID=2486853 RepID=UPI000FD6CD18|nr:LuxR family transcriptional regulator [Actinoplanes solisilvae]
MTTTPEIRTVRAPSVLRGRDTHLDAVEAGLIAARSAQGQVLLIEGGSGTGKTRLLREANDRARRAGAHTQTGQAFDGQQVLPFAPLLTAVLNGEPPIAGPDELGTLGTHTDLPHRVVRDLRTALESAAARTPVVVLLDDLQWADNGTIMAVRALTADLRHTGVLWMLATRGDTTPAVRELWNHLAGEGACRLGLPPLTLEMTAQLVADAAGAPAHPGLLALADQARGNPFLILELVRGLSEEDRLRIQDGLATAIGSRLPDRLTGNINQRLGRLSAPARRMVRMAAVLPQRFTAAQLAAVLRCRPSELVEPLEESVEADLVRGDGERLQFQHELLRQAVRESLPASLRCALEREVSDVLVDSGSPPAETTRLMRPEQTGDPSDIADAAADVEQISCLLHGRSEPEGCPPDGRAAFGWSSLTDTEHRVIRLIASGITNRQAARQLSLSPHTVNTHLRHVFAKLDINSRVQLANLAHDFPD